MEDTDEREYDLDTDGWLTEILKRLYAYILVLFLLFQSLLNSFRNLDEVGWLMVKGL